MSPQNALGMMILVVAVLTYVLRMAANLANLGELTNTLKDIAAGGGAFILAGTSSVHARSEAIQHLMEFEK